MSVRIITDSTVDVSSAAGAKLSRVPLRIYFGTDEYIDGVTISHHEFYEKLINSPVLPTTSQPTPAAFEEAFEAVTAAGDTAVVLTISSKLSGTYQSACIAAADFDNIYVVDTLHAASGAGCLAEYALQLAEQGMDAKTIAETLTEDRSKLRLFAVLDTLEYLKKGGRISGTVAFVGGMLSIKPVIAINDGSVGMIAKARGAKQGIATLISEIEKAGGIDTTKPFLLGYTGNDPSGVADFEAKASYLWNEQEVQATQLCSVVGTHVGPGAVAVSFFAK